MDDVLRILIVLALIGANAFFVIAEYAVVTARRSAVDSPAALALMDDPVRVISTVQVGITALGILTGAVGEPLVRDVLPEAVPGAVAFVLGFAIVTYLSVVLGELVPKALTLDRADRLVVLVARPVSLMAMLLKPVVIVLQASGQFVLRPFGVKNVSAGDSVRTPEELRALVDEAEGAGVIPRAQEELLHNVFDFARAEVRDVMVPAADIAWLDAELTVGEATTVAAGHPHSRYPVAAGDLGRVVGMLHIRDLMTTDDATVLRDVARPVPIVPETKDLGALLRELREQRQQLAVVGDEYGGTAGLVTMEDLLEELVGEIEDEYDLPDATLERIDEHTVRVAGSMTVDDFNETMGTALPQDGAHTMAGLVFDALGRKPEPGESARFGAVELTVEAVDGARITKLRVSS